jgi:hypothetical protein
VALPGREDGLVLTGLGRLLVVVLAVHVYCFLSPRRDGNTKLAAESWSSGALHGLARNALEGAARGHHRVSVQTRYPPHYKSKRL